MAEHVIIDGNNLLHAMHAHAPLPAVGRETLVKLVERWAKRGDSEVTLVFDGATPREGLARQMTSKRIVVCFSAPQTADDVIVAMVYRAKAPGTVRVISSDTAIRREATHRRCRHTDAVTFISELFPPEGRPTTTPTTTDEKPEKPSDQQTREWLEMFGYDDTDTDPFDGYDAMTQ